MYFSTKSIFSHSGRMRTKSQMGGGLFTLVQKWGVYICIPDGKWYGLMVTKFRGHPLSIFIVLSHSMDIGMHIPS